MLSWLLSEHGGKQKNPCLVGKWTPIIQVNSQSLNELSQFNEVRCWHILSVYVMVQTWLNVSGLLSSNGRPLTKILDLKSHDSCSEFMVESEKPSVGLPEIFLVFSFSDSTGIVTLYADQSMFGSWNTKTWHTTNLWDNHLNYEWKDENVE
jgi:hypothetical protein